jgi:2-C-methyl-D-erythritol 4-phosphate cytidylyltransferase
MDMNATAILVGAGSGVRFGNSNKAFALLAGRPVVAYSLDAFQQSASIERIVLVAGEHTLSEARLLAVTGRWTKLDRVIAGGKRRQDSVRNGLASIEHRTDHVAIHDAARPLVRIADIERCVSAAAKSGAAILAVPVTDTLKRVADNRIVETVSRDNLWAAQTPQVFATALLEKAFRTAEENDLTVTDEASLFEAVGMDVVIVEGSPANFKITVPADLVLAEAMIARAGDERS